MKAPRSPGPELDLFINYAANKKYPARKKGEGGERKNRREGEFTCYLVLFLKYSISFEPKNFSRPHADASGGKRGSGFATSSLNLINYLAYSAQITKNALLISVELPASGCGRSELLLILHAVLNY